MVGRPEQSAYADEYRYRAEEAQATLIGETFDRK